MEEKIEMKREKERKGGSVEKGGELKVRKRDRGIKRGKERDTRMEGWMDSVKRGRKRVRKLINMQVISLFAFIRHTVRK